MIRIFALASAIGVAAQAAAHDEPKGPPPKSSILAPPHVAANRYVPVNKQAVKLDKVHAESRTITVSYSVVEGLGRYARRVDKTEDLAIAADCQFRSLQLPETVDPDGKVKKLSPQEIRKLKGTNPKLPGYTVAFDALMAGQQLEVTVSKLKTAAPKTKDKAAPQEKDPVVATLIVILNDDRARKPSKPGKR